MAKIKNEEVKVKSKILDNDVTIKGKVGSKDVKIKGDLGGVPSATTERRGIIRIATDEEVIEGNDNTTAITPHTLKLATHYTHIQGVASDTWIINHNLNKKPSITIVDSAGNVVEGAEKYIDENTIEIYFNGAFKGEAYLN